MSDDESSSSGSSPPPETLIAGRAKRSTAGNRLSHLLQHLDDEDVKADLLAEEEDDQKDYSASEDGDADVAIESSDDSEDEGKPGEDDELAGEKELKKQERVESNKKRKARELVRILPMKKKVKIAEEVTSEDGKLVLPKKTERPAPASLGPLRHSSRSQTVANAKVTEARIKESKKRAVKTQEIMRLAAEKKAAEAGPELTQADRMARALEIEKENSRSLNRWEKSEQERIRTQKEKLEAMRNRKVEGPLIRYWSGPVKWIWREGPDGPVYARFKYLKKSKSKVQEIDQDDEDHSDGESKQSRRRSLPKVHLSELQQADANLANKSAGVADTVMAEAPPISDAKTTTTEDANGRTPAITQTPTTAPIASSVNEQNGLDSSFLDGIQLYASEDATMPQSDPSASKPSILISNVDEPALMESYSTVGPQGPTYPLPSMPPYTHIPTYPPLTEIQQSAHSTLPLHSEIATRTLLTLSQFPDLPSSPPPTRKNATVTDPALAFILVPYANPPLTSEEKRYLTTRARQSKSSTEILPAPPSRPTCLITGKQARFKDPKTRLPYADMPAHKAIQRVLANGCAYSGLLGAWAGIVGEGSLGRTARGVPAGFWKGSLPEREVIEL
ncbi:Vacuolar protein sorting-associated protein 72 [Elsinoe australis]|uniref:Vacuolar protein sorting-associated protein 72 n=1 Tax=Elsinoe australis TaxID=40998 RepID=A0A2P7ZYA9_9PEZI|nr:Vacuolar protein sorting-associated protein 72 [Elsinoe australis]